MTLLAPAYLAVAGGLAALVVALHFIATREPATVPLPTARFAPDRPVRARTRAFKLSDLLLLFCRAGLILAAGAALAQPIPVPTRRPLAQIVVADRSGSVADAGAVRDSVRALLSEGDALVLFDSAAKSVAPGGDSLGRFHGVGAPGSISAALVVALRTAVSMRDDVDSFEMAIVSAFTAEEMDQATESIRALWPGAIRLVRVAARPDSVARPEALFVGGADDPLRYALPPARGIAEAGVRIVRGTPGATDSTWAGAGNRALVQWPAATVAIPSDTVGAVSAGDVVVVAPFARGARERPAEGRVVARWVDGVPAAVETGYGIGCIRTVSIPVPSAGDLVLDPRFQRLAARLAGRCGARMHSIPLDEPRLAALAATARGARVPADALGRPRLVRSPLTPWLLAGALVLGLGELLLRRRRRPDGLPEAGS